LPFNLSPTRRPTAHDGLANAGRHGRLFHVFSGLPSGGALCGLFGRRDGGGHARSIGGRRRPLPLDRATVVFNSDGGNLHVGLGIGRAIRLKEFSTMVPMNGTCASACELAWLAGLRKSIDTGARVGFHAAYIQNNGEARETGTGNALAGAYLNQLGLTQSAIAYVTEAAPENMKWLTPEDARNLGIEMIVLASKETEPAAPKTDISPPMLLPKTEPLPNIIKRVQSADIYGFDLPRMPLRTTTMEACELGPVDKQGFPNQLLSDSR
jgi:hypothetical protein